MTLAANILDVFYIMKNIRSIEYTNQLINQSINQSLDQSVSINQLVQYK